MKALIYSLIFTILFVVFGFYFNNEISRFTDEYKSSISIIENYIKQDNWNDAHYELDKYSKSFEDSKRIWYKFVDHEYFSNISAYLDILNVSIELKNSTLSFEQISKVKSTLDNILENEECTLNNIF